jgi:hypothetical protein
MGDRPVVGDECTGDDAVDMSVVAAAATEGEPIRGARTITGDEGNASAGPVDELPADPKFIQ